MLYEQGFSKVQFPNGEHNKIPSEAVDAMPWPVVWPEKILAWLKFHIDQDPEAPELKKDLEELLRIYHFSGMIRGIGKARKIDIRWGGDWDSDTFFSDQNFNDLAHYERRK
jgi:peptidoglycan L-alanyl-D-glutamate endopeptidase CwlK